ncbi:hypothetical protein ABZT17_34445 [Streptomyces sp. NPDC005648]|uniref:hypothetical protein n=1 Tax=Streptomyces sp. NPDC005648 TaxID=3157044 RepID=UPI0033BA4F90
MGIRMLHRRTASVRADTDTPPCPPRSPVPVFAADASSARIPADLATALRRTAHCTAGALRQRLTAAAEPPAWRLWAELGWSHAAGLVDRLLSDRRDGPAPR